MNRSAVITWSVVLTIMCVPTLGTAGRFPQLVDIAQTPADKSFYGLSAHDKTGYRVLSGDFNGDGLDEIAIMSSSRVEDTTRVRVAIVWDLNAQSLVPGTAGISTIWAPPGEVGSYWASMACGDFNADGCDDIVIGLPLKSIGLGTSGTGNVHVIFGSASYPANIFLEDTLATAVSVHGVPGSGGWLGDGLAAGDVNADGYADLLIGAPAYSPGGRVYVLYGREIFPRFVQLSQPFPLMTKVIETKTYQALGRGLACADVNGDGYADILMGAPGNGGNAFWGSVTLMWGSPSLPEEIFLDAATVTAMGMKRFLGADSNALLGNDVKIGDTNGDGVADLVLASPAASPNGCYQCGEVDIVPWTSNMSDVIDLALPNPGITRVIGAGIACLGERLAVDDVSGDGIDDIMMASCPVSPNDKYQTIVLYGMPGMAGQILLDTTTCITRFRSVEPTDDLGRGLAIGDVNHDGAPDVLIGAIGPSTNAGVAYVFFGKLDIVSVPPTRMFTPRFVKAYPNPFASETTLEFELMEEGEITLTVYDVTGREVAQYNLPRQRPGLLVFRWDTELGSNTTRASGVYLVHLQSLRGSAVTKIVHVR